MYALFMVSFKEKVYLLNLVIDKSIILKNLVKI
jgi:hypothetical protein